MVGRGRQSHMLLLASCSFSDIVGITVKYPISLRIFDFLRENSEKMSALSTQISLVKGLSVQCEE